MQKSWPGCSSLYISVFLRITITIAIFKTSNYENMNDVTCWGELRCYSSKHSELGFLPGAQKQHAKPPLNYTEWHTTTTGSVVLLELISIGIFH